MKLIGVKFYKCFGKSKVQINRKIAIHLKTISSTNKFFISYLLVTKLSVLIYNKWIKTFTNESNSIRVCYNVLYFFTWSSI